METHNPACAQVGMIIPRTLRGAPASSTSVVNEVMRYLDAYHSLDAGRGEGRGDRGGAEIHVTHVLPALSDSESEEVPAVLCPYRET